MNQAIQDFIAGKRIAVVGASRAGGKFGNIASDELRKRGYQVFLVHPEVQEIAGERCYPNLAALQGQVDGVLVTVPPAQGEAVVRDAVQAGMKHIWLQKGAESPEILALAQSLGVTPVTGNCILMYAPPVRSVHWWHRAAVRVFGHLD